MEEPMTTEADDLPARLDAACNQGAASIVMMRAAAARIRELEAVCAALYDACDATENPHTPEQDNAIDAVMDDWEEIR
jgi:hypothetical protein